jgi:glycosyltransferase involved in cell wall biosynthesis
MSGLHILLFEPRNEGHHLMSLHHVAEGLMEIGHRLTLAIDLRSDEAQKVLQRKNPALLSQTKQVNAYDVDGKFRGGSELQSLREIFVESNADTAFIDSLDGFISASLRRAAVGMNPPTELKGHLGGIYNHPKWFPPEFASFNNWLKKKGFARLSREGWFGSQLILSEYYVDGLQQDYPNTKFVFLPEPGQRPAVSREDARKHFDLPNDAIVLLNYGVGHRRKGLHLVTEAMRRIDSPRLFLFSAGRHNKDLPTRDEALELQERDRAKVIDRYITEEEEAMCYRACDFVLAPYLSHYCSSNVLALAVFAGRPVVASDYDLIGRRVRDRKLGVLFRDRSVDDLTEKLREIGQITGDPIAPYTKDLAAYAEELTVESYRAALQTAFPNGSS